MWIWIRLNSLEAVIVICMLESTDKAFGLRCPCPTHMGHGTCIGHSCTRPNRFFFFFLKSDEYGKDILRHNWDMSWAKKTKRAENLKHTVTLTPISSLFFFFFFFSWSSGQLFCNFPLLPFSLVCPCVIYLCFVCLTLSQTREAFISTHSCE